MRIAPPGEQPAPGVIEPRAQQEREGWTHHIQRHQGAEPARELPQPRRARPHASRGAHGLAEPGRAHLLELAGRPARLPPLAGVATEVVKQQAGSEVANLRGVHALRGSAVEAGNQLEDLPHRRLLVALRGRPRPAARGLAGIDATARRGRLAGDRNDRHRPVPNSATRSAGS